ncbi:MAG: methylated-DNA--[protein]-cysteine S-methyltransferase [Synechococcaceae cyanobacterium SM2_3_1]|nr:methylated-DNA--[protein]-cysteine S-methyltransferase [Synechococcaceae cyanobacterium SM2_3_1]
MSDYERMAEVITYIAEKVTDQPSLEEIAAHIHLSPFHFQRLFCRWAGTTPKRFLQVMTLERGKVLLENSESLLSISNSLGLTSSSRLHDHFVHLEGITPGEYKNKGKGLNIEYGIHSSPFGPIFIAMTQRGVCRAAFLQSDDVEVHLTDLQKTWPYALLTKNQEATQPITNAMFGRVTARDRPLSLCIVGTNFQIAVWRALLSIPFGAVTSYSRVAAAINRPQSSRAVGNAIAANPVAFLIPCHRVIQESGALGGYRWGATRKQVIQYWERVQTQAKHSDFS